MNAPKLWIVLTRCHHALAVLVERDIVGLGLCLSDFAVLEALLIKVRCRFRKSSRRCSWPADP